MTHMEFKNIIKELDTDGDKMLDLREVIIIEASTVKLRNS